MLGSEAPHPGGDHPQAPGSAAPACPRFRPRLRPGRAVARRPFPTPRRRRGCRCPNAATGVLCNICRWQGDAFTGRKHVEFSQCPACGSNGRDRFLHWCLTERVDLTPRCG